MARSGVRIDPSARTHVDAAINEWMEDVIGDVILGDARDFVPKASGRLHDSLRAECHDKVLRVGSLDVNYCTAIELGLPEMTIVPRNKKALYWPGADHPVAKVNLPARAPQPFLRPALFQRRTP
ncbi:hypothetical protein OG342_04870 [Streptomyces bobili]|uniref:hypothetical protein n=1 Tax=Streptomyces bobili TaxID=67280 RepID=UPI002251C2C8|nr:hypothetical protein [Streptomyces bobili]MCX5522201.1 hypothetical protein [Streptomyces bobili]